MMCKDLTVIYYTSNRENPNFERRIKRTLLHTIRGLPLISVSQKPMDFGRNICVGDVGASGHNAWRQLQIGAMEARTKYVCPTEADFLYPKEYFEFVPPRDDMFYMAQPVYVLFAQRGLGHSFHLKQRGSEAAMVVARDHLLKRLDEIFKGLDMWGPVTEAISIFRGIRRDHFTMSIPAVTFKTDRNMHRKTPHDTLNKLKDLPYWGNSHALLKRYLG